MLLRQIEASSHVVEGLKLRAQRSRAKQIAWGSFMAAVALICTAMVSLFLEAYWLAALAGSTAIGAYGLLYTAGMNLNELDRSNLFIVRE